MMRHFPERRLIVVFEPHTFSWRNRAALKWYDDVFRGAGKVFIFEPAAQGAATHDQVSHAEIIARVRAAGYDADPISDPAQRHRGARRHALAGRRDPAALVGKPGRAGGAGAGPGGTEVSARRRRPIEDPVSRVLCDAATFPVTYSLT